MDDIYWERVLRAANAVEEAARSGRQEGDSSLVARLITPQAEELEYRKPEANVRDAAIPASHPVPVRIYSPSGTQEKLPLLIWSHGGAFLGGDLDMPEADTVAREVVSRANAVVISVDYRLCLEGVHFPAPNDDLSAVFEWAVRNAIELGIDPNRVSMGGASAGACLTAAVALRLWDVGAQFAALVLAYPVVHAVLPPPSAELAQKVASLPAAMAFTPEVIEPVMENYLGAPTGQANAYAIAGVASETQLAVLPPTLIVNCEYDGLRASGERFARQLRDAHVEVSLQIASNVAHGHLNRPGLPQAQESLAEIANWVARWRSEADA